MRQAWRWYGPKDSVSLDDARQAGATDIVTALHEAPAGAAWTSSAVAARKALIETAPAGASPLRWSVVESIPVPDEIKREGAAASAAIEVWIASMEAVAAHGVTTICYNFMPVLDWTRTDLAWPLPSGARALRFDQARFAAFDLHILRRAGAEADYPVEVQARARALADALTPAEADGLTRNIAAGLPGASTDSLDLEGLRDKLAAYAGLGADRLRRNLIAFLERVTPAAEARGVRLTLHPDDPPRPLFGLPRIASTLEDYLALFEAVPSAANGMCFCTGSLGVAASNDLPHMARRLAPRIHFAHLRATRREPDGSFFETDHLDGDFDMIAVLRALLAEDRNRPQAAKLPFRPDHGHQMLDDLGKTTNPGYSAIGRLKGLAELRGAIRALESTC
ncbi:MAG: mannonate dehydratase [Roseiarcus sp.]|jgi:mannonate dehydratase